MKNKPTIRLSFLLFLFVFTANSVKGAEPPLVMTLTDVVIANAQITLETAAALQIKSSLRFPGQVKLNTEKVAQVVPRLSGVVTEIRKTLGDLVKKNEVIVIIESRELANAKSDYIEALNRLEFAKVSFEREEALLKQKISAKEDYLASRQAMQEAELGKQVTKHTLLALGLRPADISALVIVPKGKERRIIFSEQSLTRYALRAPVDGLVIEKNLTLGAAVDEKTPLFVLADRSSVWVDARVLAKDLNRLKVGQKARVTSKNAGLGVAAEVIYIGSRFDEKTQMGMVRLEIQNPLENTKRQWRPGLFVTVDLSQEPVAARVAVSVDAIQLIGDSTVLFVQIGKDFEVRPVTLGLSDGRKVEILEGLSAGEQVVTRNSFVIKAEWLNQGGELPASESAAGGPQ
ncbi:MAG: HlyD family efflux transporter periplasmic adaptor subunit [Nitrospirae bacterium]|nr:HlyD family efflux transporter periplasmic adaptor subunit [Candidatus Manganitrophaceae bacterium]